MCLAGYATLRCRSCEYRFKRTLWDVGNSIYARCPNCYGLELSSWELDDYHVRLWWRIKITFGANPWRCEPCRRNFVSFLPRKVRWVRRKPNANTTTEAGSISHRV